MVAASGYPRAMCLTKRSAIILNNFGLRMSIRDMSEFDTIEFDGTGIGITRFPRMPPEWVMATASRTGWLVFGVSSLNVLGSSGRLEPTVRMRFVRGSET